MTRVTLDAADFVSSGDAGPQLWGDGVTLQGFGWDNAPAEIVYDTQFTDFGLGVRGGYFDQLDFSQQRGNVAERVEIDFGGTVKNVVVTLGQFNPDEYGYFETGAYTAIAKSGDVVANGIYSPQDSLLGKNEKIPGSLKMFPLALADNQSFDQLILTPTGYSHGSGNSVFLETERPFLKRLGFTYPEDYPWEQNSNFNIVELSYDRVTATTGELAAVGDDYDTREDETLVVAAAAGVLTNDDDADGDTLTAVLVDDVSNGALTLNADGGFTYTPANGFTGTDSFTYQASDGTAASDPVTVTLEVTPTNDPLPGEPPADFLDFSTASITGFDGRYDKDRGDYTVSADGRELAQASQSWEQAARDVTVTPDTRLQFAFEGEVEGEIHGIMFAGQERLAPATTIQIWGTDSFGIESGDFAYQGDGSRQSFDIPVGQYFTGSFDRIVFFTDDDRGVGADSTWSDVVIIDAGTPGNRAPEAVGDDYDTREDETLVVAAAAGVLTNDDDADGDTLTAVLVDDVSNGALTLNADGGFTYTPANGFTGTDSFTYQASDGTAASDPVTVTLEVTPTNDPLPGEPPADFLDFSTASITGFDGRYDKDRGDYTVSADGRELAQASQSWEQAARDVTVTPDTRLQFAFEGEVEGEIHGIMFAGQERLAPATTIQIWGTDSFGIESGDFAYQGDGSRQSFDIPVGQYFTGSFDRIVFFTDDDRGVGADSTWSDVVIIDAGTPGNRAPEAVGDDYDTREDETLVVAAAAGVLTNDDDADGDTLTAVLVDDVSNGALTLNADGGFTYTPANGFTGTDSFTYQASDGTAASDPVTVTLEVTPTNDPLPGEPPADFLDFSTASITGFDGRYDKDRGDYTVSADGRELAQASQSWEQAARDVTVTPDTRLQFAFEGEVEGEIHGIMFAGQERLAPATTIQIWGTDSFGIESDDFAYQGDGSRQSFDIPVGQYFTGSFDRIVFFTDDDRGVGADSTWSDVVIIDAGTPGNRAPEAVGDDYDTREDETLVVAAAAGVLTNDDDADGDTLTAVLVDDVSNGALTLNADGGFTYTPANGFTGTDSFTYQASDGTAASDPVTVTLEVTPTNDPLPGEPPADFLDFSTASITGFDGRYDKDRGDYTVSADGRELAQASQSWEQAARDVTVTPDTRLQFAFEGEVEGEIHGIMFAGQERLAPATTIQIWGTDSFGIESGDFAYQGDGSRQSFDIPVGQYFTGSFDRIVFFTDDDRGVGADSTWSDVVIL